MKSIFILNTGGTFNKRYDAIKGTLNVPEDNKSIKQIIQSFHNLKISVKNIINKDSLDFSNEDRALLLEEVKNSKIENIIIIHGTDTMDKSAYVLKEAKIAKKVVFTGSMVPFCIDKVEATANLALAVGFFSAKIQNGTYIAMHGVVAKSDELLKDRVKGKFLLV